MSRLKLTVNEFVGDAPDCDPARHPVLRVAIEELAAIGFVPLGVKREQCEGHPAIDSLIFAHEGHRAFASMFVAHEDMPMVYLLTPFENGRAVLTGWYERRRIDTDWVIAQGTDGPCDAYGLLETHRRGVALHERRGHQVVSRFDQEMRTRSCREWYLNPDT